MEKIETTVIGNLIYNEDFSRKVLPFVRGEYFDNYHERVIFEEISNFITNYKLNHQLLGLQLNIGGRGLDPNRTSNFNTRQNGYDIKLPSIFGILL